MHRRFFTKPSNDLSGEVLKTIRNNGELLRTLPAFFEFEITSMHNQDIFYHPSTKDTTVKKEISVMDFKKSLGKISSFVDDAVISLSIRNEPSLHSELPRIVELVLSYKNFSLLIETSGTEWNEEDLDKILSMSTSRITWIVSLDALDKDLYQKIRGDGYTKAYDFAMKLININSENTWVQAVRMKENELDNELFL